MRIAVLKESASGETRVAASPETVKKFIALGASVAVETGAGIAAAIADADYAAAGAEVVKDPVKGADIVLGVQGPDPAALKGANPGAWIVAGLDPFLRFFQAAHHEHAEERRRRADEEHSLPRFQTAREKLLRGEGGDAAPPPVGASSAWTSETRENVSGTSTVVARNDNDQGGMQCITVSDVIIVNGEETTADKRMCRKPGSARYSLMA